MCVYFTDLNKTCPKDSFPLPHIDPMVNSTIGHTILSFMDAYLGYNQIYINLVGEKKTTFITNLGLYCYRVISFQLKNVRATYKVNNVRELDQSKYVGVY